MRRVVLAAVLALLPLSSAAQPSSHALRWGQIGPGTMASIERYRQMLAGVPAPYRSMRDRTGNPQGKLARGAALFQDRCASCHGVSGRGDGTTADTVYPRPADLSWLKEIPSRQAEPYMYWSIAEGGSAFGSDMPAFKSQLPPNDVWAVISFIRSGSSGR